MNAQINPHFTNFLAEGNILCGLESVRPTDAIQELVRCLTRNTAGLDADSVLREVLLREEVMPTVIAAGLAVPHARLPNLDRMLVAMGTSPTGIDFHLSGMPPVKVLILILTPADDPGLHLQVFSALAKDFSNPDTVNEVATLTTPEEIKRYFSDSENEIPQYLTAADVMNRTPLTLKENNTLEEAIELFATKHADEVAVVDDDGELRGVLSLSDLLKFSLPEHILWMNDLSSVYRFQPFSEVLKSASETKVADVMREGVAGLSDAIPAIQLAKLFLMDHCQKLFVVDASNRLKGEVALMDFSAKLFWA